MHTKLQRAVKETGDVLDPALILSHSVTSQGYKDCISQGRASRRYYDASKVDKLCVNGVSSPWPYTGSWGVHTDFATTSITEKIKAAIIKLALQGEQAHFTWHMKTDLSNLKAHYKRQVMERNPNADTICNWARLLLSEIERASTEG